MDFHPNTQADAFCQEIRAFLAENWTREGAARIKKSGTQHDWPLHREAAERGWLRSAMPVSPDGQSRGPEELAALFREFEIAGAPYDGISVAMIIASILTDVGSEFHKSEVVPRLLSGESVACLGYTEPECGSDVAAVKTRAERSGAQDPRGTIGCTLDHQRPEDVDLAR